MIEQIKLIAFISLAVIAIILIIVLFRKGSRDRLLSEIQELQVAFNDIRTTPLSIKFNNAQAVAKRNEETDKEIKEYYSRYTETQGVIDEIDNMLVSIENYKQEHNYREIKAIIPELKNKIAKCYKEVKATDEFLKKYDNKDTEQRTFSTNLKQEFQIVRDTIRKNVNQLTIAYEAIEAKLEACSSMFTKSEDAMFANDYATAQDALENIEKEIHNIKLVVNEIPPIVKEATVIIPSLIEEAESASSYIKQKGINVDHLNVEQTIEKLKAELKECTELVSKLEVDGLQERIQNAKTEVKSLNAALANEDTKFQNAKQSMEDINSILIDIKNMLDFIQDSANTNDNLYASDEEKPDLNPFNQRLSELKDTHFLLSKKLESLTEPASSLNEEVSSALTKSLELREEISSLKDDLDKSVGDIQRAKSSLIKFQLVVNQAEISVRASHLPSISDSFAEDLKECKKRIDDIKKALEEPTVDLESLNAKINESMNFIYSFSNNVKNLVGLSIMTENAIVFGNKFRSSHKEIDADLSKSEFSFLNGEYTKAVQLAIKTMDTLYPDTNSENSSVNN